MSDKSRNGKKAIASLSEFLQRRIIAYISSRYFSLKSLPGISRTCLRFGSNYKDGAETSEHVVPTATKGHSPGQLDVKFAKDARSLSVISRTRARTCARVSEQMNARVNEQMNERVSLSSTYRTLVTHARTVAVDCPITNKVPIDAEALAGLKS